MPGHIDQMRQRYDEFNQGDVQSATQDWADDFVWQGSNSTELPGGGEHRGKEQALQVLQQAVAPADPDRHAPGRKAAWAGLRVAPRRLHSYAAAAS